MRTLTEGEVAEHLGRIADQGYTVVEDAIEPDLVDELVETLDRLEHDLEIVPADNAFEGRRTSRVYNLLVHGDVFARVPVHPNVLPLVEGVLDPGCLLSSLSSIAIGPDETPQPIHADDQIIPLPKPHPAVGLQQHVGAHRLHRGQRRHPAGAGLAPQDSPDLTQRHDSVPAVMGRGSVLVWHGSLWHGGGENTTAERRVGLACNYCAGYVRQQENQQLGIPREIARGFDRRLARLCGYGIYSGLIGHIDKHDPIELLGDAPPSSMVWDLL